MTYIPEFNNEDNDANLVENKARIKPDYSVLSADAFPALTDSDAGRILEHTDTADRFRWSGAAWFQTHAAGKLSISSIAESVTVDDGSASLTVDDGGESLTVDTNLDSPLSVEQVLTHQTDAVIQLHEISRQLNILIQYQHLLHKIDLEG